MPHEDLEGQWGWEGDSRGRGCVLYIQLIHVLPEKQTPLSNYIPKIVKKKKKKTLDNS